MALNCILNRNISFSQPGSGGDDSCGGQSMSEGVGGIAKVVVYNISDVPSLTFENDNRADSSLVVDTINSTGQFYTIDFNSATYNEEYDNHKWTHTLTLEVPNISTLFEDILADGVNGKYLVCFLPNGSEDWRCFGWKYGATLDYSLNISPDSLGYTIRLEDVSEYPLFAVLKDNFGSKTKTYTPIFKPLYDIYFCEQGTDGRHTGYLVAMYVVKTNSAGQPLDRNNRLVQWSGLKQDAYKIAGITSDGGYNIIGTYQKTASFDGKPVRIYDLEKCPANVTNSIFINSKKVETINLNSTITAGTYTITSSDEWSMVSEPQYVTISPVEGGNGNTPSTFHHNGVGGCDKVEFMNKATHEIVVLNTCVNIINIGKKYDFPNEVSSTVITPIVKGCDTGYTYTITPSVSSYKDDLGYIHINFPSTDEDLEYTMTLVHTCDSNERKITKIYRKGVGKDPRWILDNNYCEMNGTVYTGYRVYKYKDINPNSPTYGTYKEERERDASCNEESPNWQQTSTYCELDVKGTNTGYYVYVQTDVNPKSPTAGQTREERQYDVSHCPKQDTNPHWIEDDNFEAYCETMWYEPAHVEGNTGYRISREIDDNRYSPTWGQKRDVRELSELCPAPSTEPNIEEISYSCQLETDSQGNVYMNGYADVTGLDKNIYSPTYLSSVTVAVYDEERCPPNIPTTCDCNVYGDIAIPAELTDIMVVGAYTTTGCSATPRSVTFVSGTNFLGDFELINSYIRAKVISENTSTTDTRTGTYKITLGTCEKNLTFTQSAKGGCDCSSFSARTSNVRVSADTGATEFTVGYYTGATGCEEQIYVQHRDGVDFLDNFRLLNGVVYATVKTANTGAERSSTYYVKQGSCSDYFTAYQENGTPTPPTCDSYDIEIVNTGITGVADGYTNYCPTLITLSGVGKTYCVQGSSRTVVEEQNISTAYTTSINGDPAEKTSSITLTYDSTIAQTSTSHTESFRVHTAPSSAWELHGAPATYNPATREYEFEMHAYEGYQIYNAITFRLICSDTVFVDREPSLGGVQKFNGWDFQVWHEGNTFYIKCTTVGTTTVGTKMLSFTLINGGFGTNATITAFYSNN